MTNIQPDCHNIELLLDEIKLKGQEHGKLNLPIEYKQLYEYAQISLDWASLDDQVSPSAGKNVGSLMNSGSSFFIVGIKFQIRQSAAETH